MIKSFESELSEMLELVKKKHSDYSSGSINNFELAEKLWITTTEKAILVRMSDKMARICNLIESDPSVKSEAITDTLRDLANYAIILKIYLTK